MKTIKRMWLPLMLLAAVAVVFPACETNDLNDPDEYPGGVITLKMRHYDNGGTGLEIDHGYGNKRSVLIIGSDNNFYFYRDNSYGSVFKAGQICDTGHKKLSAVRSVPTNGWAEAAAVTPGHSYVIRIGEENDQYDPLKYYKLYVVDYIESTGGGIIGAEVKYCQWNP